jgi:hypothetical protein
MKAEIKKQESWKRPSDWDWKWRTKGSRNKVSKGKRKVYGASDHLENYSKGLLDTWKELEVSIQKIRQMKNYKQ